MTAVESVLGQTMSDLELIVCDDSSSDQTSDVLGRLRDPRIRVLRNAVNMGPGVSRDKAINVARGVWLAVIDGDDAWRPNRLERLLEVAANDRDVLVFDDLMVCHDSEGALVPWRPVHGCFAFGTDGSNAHDISLEDYIRAERLLIKPMMPLRFIREHGVRHTTRRFAEDAEFFIRLGVAGATMRYLPEPLYLYRVSPGSLTALSGDWTLMRRCLEDCLRWEGMPDTVREALADKVAALLTNEALYELAQQARRGNLVGMLRLVSKEPRILRVLPRRLVRHLSYQVHRIKYRAQGR